MLNAMAARISPSVLVVDDDELAHEVLSEMLGLLGVQRIQAAYDGRAALRQLAAVAPAPDFLLCDVFMPDMDGIEFLDHLAQQGYAGSIIILSGGDADMLNLAKLIAISNGLRVLDSFVKPVALEELAQAMGLIPPR